ncbi:MAG TPA: peptide deformylase [Bacteroidota bacterium]|jgi:peptide deformylase|nr:peptide deformylase [Bacteroidota bacterium]
MAVREILLLGNPLLRTQCERVGEFSDSAVQQTVSDLFDTLAEFRRTHGFGRGIAAPQVGVTKRITVINVDTPIVLINPEIADRSAELMTLWDDCFSFPEILVKVRRNVKITVAYQDVTGKHQKLEAEGSLSELLQHEIDHLDGILAVDRALNVQHIILRSERDKFDRVVEHGTLL